jgi:glycosyltransferase involved in cell wall biosynthesis
MKILTGEAVKEHRYHKSSQPLVSVVIPTYNYATYVTKAISSCLEQTYKPVEVVVVDDGSTDNTFQVLKEFGTAIRYIFQENKGVSAARNKGMASVQGDYITFVDADDYMTKDSIEIRMKIMHKFPDIGIVVSDKYTTDLSGKTLLYKQSIGKDKISDTFYKDLLLKKMSFATAAAVIRASVAKRFTFPEHITNGEDIAYFMKIFFTTRGYYLARPTVVIMKHPDSQRHNIEKIKRQDMDIVSTIFNDPLYKGCLNHLRRRFTSNRYLSLSRNFYLSGEYDLARQYYFKGIALKPLHIFKFNYLSKFLKTFFNPLKNHKR